MPMAKAHFLDSFCSYWDQMGAVFQGKPRTDLRNLPSRREKTGKARDHLALDQSIKNE